MIYILFDYKDGYNIASKLAPPKCSMVHTTSGDPKIFARGGENNHSTLDSGITLIERESYIKTKATITKYKVAITLGGILH